MKNSDIYKKILELNSNGTEFVLITVIEKRGSGPSETGGRMIYTSSGKTFGTIGGGTLEKLVLKESAKVLQSGSSIIKKYMLDKEEVLPDAENTGMLCGGDVTLFIEYMAAEEQIFIFGAGHVGKSLIHHLSGLSYRLTVIDDREDVLTNITGVRKIFFKKDPSTVFSETGDLNRSNIVIATYSHELDYKIFKNIIERGFVPRYLGIVASDKKIDTIISRSKKEVKKEFKTDFLYSPAGLDIGGRSPAEIALSIASEIQSVRYEKKELKHLSKKFRN